MEQEGDDRPQGILVTSEESVCSSHATPVSREVVANLRVFADEAPIGIAMTAGKLRTVRYVNPAFRRLTGTEDQLLLGQPLADTVPLFGDERVRLLFGTLLLTDVAHCGTAVLPHNGLTLTAWPLHERTPGEESCGIIQLREDLEPREQPAREIAPDEELRTVNERLVIAALREEELASRARAASDAKSAFLATMSHELRTPLNAIIGYTSLLDEGIYGPIELEQHRHLGRINTSAHHLLSLIDEVLTHTRVDAGREPVHWTEVHSERILDEASALTMPLAIAKGLTLTVLAPVQPCVFVSDAGKVLQILINLLGNAIKFTDHGEVELAMSAEDAFVCFTVRDTGMGIPGASLEHIFDPFWQADQGPSRRVGGTGLGLSVSRGLAQLLDGSLTVQSTAGAGSTFTLRLPLRSHDG